MSFDVSIRKVLGNCTLDISFQSEAKLAAIVGKSGIGKTTLLNCVAGLVRPDSGHITVGGQTLFNSNEKCDLPSSQRQCGYLFQDNRLFPHLTITANLTYGARRGDPTNAVASYDDVVALLDIQHLLDRKPANLSGGEMRRVAIGRALLSNPRFLLLDEPLASLDAERSEQIMLMLERLRDDLAIPTLYVSHDAAEVSRLTDTVIAID